MSSSYSFACSQSQPVSATVATPPIHPLLHFLLLSHSSSNSISAAQAVARSAASSSSQSSSSLLPLRAAVSCKNFQGCHVDCLCLRIISVIKYDPEIRQKLASKFNFAQLCADFLFFLFLFSKKVILKCYFSGSNCECDWIIVGKSNETLS